MSGEPTDSSSGLNAPLTGTWHLLDGLADEANVPQHRMDLAFREEAGQLRGWVVSRVSGDELPLIKTLSFDGDTLRLQLAAPPDRAQGDMPFLVMRVVQGKLEGHWIQNGTPVGPELKLIRRNQEQG